MTRADRHRNPTAFTSALAKQAGLKLNVDYVVGNPFNAGLNINAGLYTAKLLGDPVEITIRLIDKVGFYTINQQPRWTYIGVPAFLWLAATPALKRQVIGWMYSHEGGTAMLGLFAPANQQPAL